MGVEFKYELYAKPSLIPPAERLIAATLLDLEQSLSDYRQDSEVNRLSKASPHAEPVPGSSMTAP